MPIYMDLHIVPGITAKGAAEAHRQDLLIQKEYNCNCMTYWVDKSKDSAFCLIDAPNEEAVKELHSKAHGLMTHQIIEVNSTVVESFLGRIYDPETSDVLEGQLKVFNDSAFRVLMIINCCDKFLMARSLGEVRAQQLRSKYKTCVQSQIKAHEGREVEHHNAATIISFTSTFKAVACALAIQNALSEFEKERLDLKMSINAGMPVTQNSILFGDTIQFAKRLLYATKTNQIVVASIIKEITHKNYFRQQNHKIISLSSKNEKMLDQLMDILEENSRDSSFKLNDFCKYMAMSKSGLYRLIQELTGKSPNAILKEFRLQKALELLNIKGHNISEIAFDSGFSSPAYFSKCFLKTFGMLPSYYRSSM